MADNSDEDKAEKLKAALWYAVGKMVDEECLERGNKNASPQYIGALTALVMQQIENVAQDLESFSRHAGRTTIKTDDVLLVARRNEALHGIIKNFINERAAAEGKGEEKAKR